ncbi:ABC transporter ATP-binding protein [Deinococcus sp.]|uniref:ABC transporter ATP-binding protein n=1 Tax=Deinococcus sp. TaxID=47478 RepID=UPI003B58CE93
MPSPATEFFKKEGQSPQQPLALELHDLTKVFKTGRAGHSVTAVNKVSLSIARGEVLALVGESGSGKSTIARLIARLETPTSGYVSLNGQMIPNRLGRADLRKLRRRVQIIFQDPYASLNALNSVGYALSRPLRIHKLADARTVGASVNALLERVGLSPGAAWAARRPGELSGGQRQRVVIARALAAQPELILADEPTSALDVSIRLDVMNLLLDLKDQAGLSMLFITHDLSGAHYMADRVAVMYAGSVVEIGPADAVIGQPQMPYTQLLRRAAPKFDEPPEAPDAVPLRGEVPDLKALPPGCAFEPRCPHAMPVCKSALPPLYEIAPGHQVRCVLFDPARAAKAGD